MYFVKLQTGINAGTDDDKSELIVNSYTVLLLEHLVFMSEP